MKGLASVLGYRSSSISDGCFEWNQADQKTEEALAVSLASQSEQIESASGSDYAHQVILAVESLRHKETAAGDLALRSSMALLDPSAGETRSQFFGGHRGHRGVQP